MRVGLVQDAGRRVGTVGSTSRWQCQIHHGACEVASGRRGWVAFATALGSYREEPRGCLGGAFGKPPEKLLHHAMELLLLRSLLSSRVLFHFRAAAAAAAREPAPHRAPHRAQVAFRPEPPTPGARFLRRCHRQRHLESLRSETHEKSLDLWEAPVPFCPRLRAGGP